MSGFKQSEEINFLNCQLKQKRSSIYYHVQLIRIIVDVGGKIDKRLKPDRLWWLVLVAV